MVLLGDSGLKNYCYSGVGMRARAFIYSSSAGADSRICQLYERIINIIEKLKSMLLRNEINLYYEESQENLMIMAFFLRATSDG